MTINLAVVAATVAPFEAALAAMAVAAAGILLLRRRPQLMPVVATAAALAGWEVAAQCNLRSAVWPRTVAESLVGASALLLIGSLAALRWRSRWIGTGTVLLVAWFLSGTPTARPEYWRVLFGSAAAAWLLGRTGGGEPRRAFAAVAALWGASVLAGMPAAAGIALVLAAVAAVLWAARRPGDMPPGLTMLALAGVEVGSGRAMRGGVALIDLACLGALGAPALVPAVERMLRRRTRRGAAAAPALVAGLVVGAAWLAARLLREHRV